MTDMRKLINIMELDQPDQQTSRDREGRVLDKNVSYEVSDDKIIATLSSYKSQVYTKLAQKITELVQLEEQVKALETEVKQMGREQIADLFGSADAVRTRVIDTKSFILKITKDPAPATTVKYASVIQELATHLTPELVLVMNSLVEKFSTVQKAKPAGLSYSAKTEESLNLSEGVWDKLVGVLAKFKAAIQNWGNKYDSKLADLKAQVSMGESALIKNVSEAPMALPAGTVYSGSYEGKVVGTVPNKPETTIIELKNGDRVVVPTASIKSEKPGMMKRAFSKLVGEDEELDEYSAYDKVGKDFQVGQGKEWGKEGDASELTHTDAEVVSTWTTPGGRKIYVWSLGNGKGKVVDGKGAAVALHGSPTMVVAIERSLEKMYHCKKTDDHVALEISDSFDMDGEEGEQGLTELAEQPSDMFPVASTLDDAELLAQKQWLDAMMKLDLDLNTEMGQSLMEYAGEVNAECEARGCV